MDSFIRQHNNVDVSVAVSTDVGLITPIVFNAHHKGLATISEEVQSLPQRREKENCSPASFREGRLRSLILACLEVWTISQQSSTPSILHFAIAAAREN
uniref:2-oxoacid dehydrogenase acyltransferase catalytic domain-containing protein n=1 Tax=Ditylenchus dipsaci TaxID=166011 RepID=A0A915EKD5_9BILA